MEKSLIFLLICLCLFSCSPTESQLIAYSSTRLEETHIYLLDINRAKETQISQGDAEHVAPLFSPDGKHLYFQRKSGTNTDIVHHHMETGVQYLVTDGPQIDNQLSIAPDSKALAYTTSADIYIAKEDGSHSRNISRDFLPDFRSQWHPNGKEILWHTRRNDNYDLVSYNVVQDTMDYLANTDLNEFDGRWSPDGKQLAYLVMVEKAPQLYLADSVGGNPTPITELGCRCSHQRWAGDSRKLVYLMNCADTKQIRYFDLDKMQELALPVSGNIDRPQWDNEANRIWFEKEHRGFTHIYYYDLDRERERAVTAGMASYFDLVLL